MRMRYKAMGVVILAGLAIVAWTYAFAPVNDPSYFCGAPDPSPVTSIAASTILQDCAAGKTFTVAKGETIVVDLAGYTGIDTYGLWGDLMVSDNHVLRTVSPPARIRGTPPLQFRLDEVAVYQAGQTGEATLSAVEQGCTANFGGHCGRGHLWSVTIRVR